MQIRKTKLKSVFQSDAKTKHEKRNSNPFLKWWENEKQKPKLKSPFQSAAKTKHTIQIRFSMSQVDEKRKIEMEMEFHFTRPKKYEN